MLLESGQFIEWDLEQVQSKIITSKSNCSLGEGGGILKTILLDTLDI